MINSKSTAKDLAQASCILEVIQEEDRMVKSDKFQLCKVIMEKSHSHIDQGNSENQQEEDGHMRSETIGDGWIHEVIE